MSNVRQHLIGITLHSTALFSLSFNHFTTEEEKNQPLFY
ncbi:hypothetical protein QY96_01843 [Bacillus thermotolerans]|uniref:Uncharacterized protein n=1 Tax=Bacillus thermotolerans TaxID=1221996 RepID=A0A0F5I582_BACTR|nr:hypothetical protein QY95_01425 [Bacillus thermotolerans]KKB41801.1 hypothetical protein QY96_01843 [Bacillus thermotolerans]